MVTPLSIRVRASVENLTSLAAIGAVSLTVLLSGGLGLGGAALEHAHDVAFLHDQQLVAVELDLGAGPLAEQHPVTNLDAHRRQLALLAAGTRANRQDLALHRLLLGGVRDDQPTLGLLLFLDALDDDTVVQRPELHLAPSWPGFPGRLMAGTRTNRVPNLARALRLMVEPVQGPDRRWAATELARSSGLVSSVPIASRPEAARARTHGGQIAAMRTVREVSARVEVTVRPPTSSGRSVLPCRLPGPARRDYHHGAARRRASGG